MKKVIIIAALLGAVSTFAGHRTVVITTLDTIKVTQTFNDTTILVKQDTAIIKGVVKPKVK